jgi:hypothetical protein
VHQQRRRRGADFPRHLEATTSASVGHGAFRTGLAAVAGIAELNMNGRKMHNPKQRPVRRAAVGAAAQCLVPGLYRSQNNTHCGPVRAGSWCRADGSSGPATVMGRRQEVVGQDPPGPEWADCRGRSVEWDPEPGRLGGQGRSHMFGCSGQGLERTGLPAGLR